MEKVSEVSILSVILFGLASISDTESSKRQCFNAMKAIKILVDPKVYDKEMHPCENGQPVVVRVGLYIVSISNIEESDMTFDIQFYFRQAWRDDRLAYANLNISNESYIELSYGYFWDAIWVPDAYFEHERNAKLHTIMLKNQFLRLFSDGVIFLSSRLTLTLYNPMEFYNFPMDKQVCKIIFGSYGHSTKSIIYKWMTNKTETSVFWNKLSLPQFKIEKIEIGSHVATYTVGNFSVLTLYLHLQRRIAFYLTRNYIPAALIVIISWLSFWVDRDCAPARIGIGITTILTMTTLLIGVGQLRLPVVSYMNALDWYYIGCFAFVFAALCEYAIVNYFDTKQRQHVALLRMNVAGLVEGKDEVASNRCVENSGFKFGMDLSHESSQFSKPYQEPEVKQPAEDAIMVHPHELGDIIDNAVRKVYPLLFLIFNIVYCIMFYDSYFS